MCVGVCVCKVKALVIKSLYCTIYLTGKWISFPRKDFGVRDLG